MSPESFCYWLQGAIELGLTKFDEQQVQIIQDHLNLVFNKETPERQKAKDDLMMRILIGKKDTDKENADRFSEIVKKMNESNKINPPVQEDTVTVKFEKFRDQIKEFNEMQQPRIFRGPTIIGNNPPTLTC